MQYVVMYVAIIGSSYDLSIDGHKIVKNLILSMSTDLTVLEGGFELLGAESI